MEKIDIKEIPQRGNKIFMRKYIRDNPNNT